MKKITFVLILLFVTAAFAKKRVIPPAPLPAEVMDAKAVFLVNGGGSELAYDAFYQEMKSWGKYQIVGSPDAADIIITLQYWVEKNGSSTVPVTNTYTGQTSYYSSENQDPQMKLTIIDAKSKAVLWSSIDHRKLVFRWNLNKEITKTAVSMVDELEARSR